jgi:hypothetical protein
MLREAAAMQWGKPLAALAAALEKTLDRALCAAGAVACAQLPEFMQQYLQRLGGHLDEARRQLESFARVARESGLSLADYIARLSANADAPVAKTGGVIRDLAARVDELAAAERALRETSAWTRPFVFLRDLDRDIAGGTWGVFRPAVPTTLEGLMYAAAGVVLALAIYHAAVKWPLARWRAARERRKADGTQIS